MMASFIHVTGLRELDRAFGKANRALNNDLRDALAEAASPVRADAQMLAAASIRNVQEGDPWSRMRIGVGRWVAYVAPLERGVKGRSGRRRRPRFADLLLARAMEPAVDRNASKVEKRLEGLLDDVCDAWERG